MSSELTSSILVTRKLKTQLAQAQLKYEQLSDRHVKLEHEYRKLRAQQPDDILDRFDKQQQGKIQQYYKEILTLKNYINQMNKQVIGDNNETVWNIKQQLKIAIGEKTSSRRDAQHYEELLQQYKWKIETIQQEKDSLANLTKYLEEKQQTMARQMQQQNEVIAQYVAEFDEIHQITQNSGEDLTSHYAIHLIIQEREDLRKNIEKYQASYQEDRAKIEDQERIIMDYETYLQQINYYVAEGKSQQLVHDYSGIEKDRKIERLEGELEMLKETQDTLRKRVLQSYDEEKCKQLDEKLLHITKKADSLAKENEDLKSQLSVYQVSGESEVQKMVQQLKTQYQTRTNALLDENAKLNQRISTLEKCSGNSHSIYSKVDYHITELQSENAVLKEQVYKGIELANKLNQQLQTKPKDNIYSAQIRSELVLKNAQIYQLQQYIDLLKQDLRDAAEKEQMLRYSVSNYYMTNGQDQQLIQQQRSEIQQLFEQNKLYQEKLAEQVYSNEALYSQYYELLQRSNEQLVLYQSALDRSGISMVQLESHHEQAAPVRETLKEEDVVMSVVAHDDKRIEASYSDAHTHASDKQLNESQISDVQQADPISIKAEASTSELVEKKKKKIVEEAPAQPEAAQEEDKTEPSAEAPKKKKKASTASADTSKVDEPEKKADEPTAETAKTEASTTDGAGEKKKKKKASTASAEVSKPEEPAVKEEESVKTEPSVASTGEKKKKKKTSTGSAETSKADEPVAKAQPTPAPAPEAPKAEPSTTDSAGTGEKKKKKKASTASAETSKADEPAKPAEPSDASATGAKKKKKVE